MTPTSITEKLKEIFLKYKEIKGGAPTIANSDTLMDINFEIGDIVDEYKRDNLGLIKYRLRAEIINATANDDLSNDFLNYVMEDFDDYYLS